MHINLPIYRLVPKNENADISKACCFSCTFCSGNSQCKILQSFDNMLNAIKVLIHYTKLWSLANIENYTGYNKFGV